MNSILLELKKMIKFKREKNIQVFLDDKCNIIAYNGHVNDFIVDDLIFDRLLLTTAVAGFVPIKVVSDF